ncbi:MAG: hypothetical protein KY475_22580 [Planctomycetes bacterium]|nr:hypothetical protein [Planctomycetota bacterium]
MPSSSLRQLAQFRLRTLLAALTLLIVAGNGFLFWWRMPFDIERRTTTSSWDLLEYFRRHDIAVRLDKSAFSDSLAILEASSTWDYDWGALGHALGFVTR